MWEYKISKSDLGFIIYRKKIVGKLLLIEYLTSRNMRTLNKQFAKTFYNKDSAISALVVAKIRGDKVKEKEPEETEEKKQTRSEL